MAENSGRKALGRGFGALLKSVETTRADDDTSVFQIRLDEISPNPHQPRREFDVEALEELAQSIRVKGVIQPILVRKAGLGSFQYELVAGERRLRASRLAGFEEIPAIIKDVKDKDLRELALIENIQREALNPIEESNAYKDLLEEHGYTQEDLARRVGKNRSTIANMIRLQQLPPSIQGDLADSRLSVGHARTLLAIENKDEQLELRDQIIDQRFSVRQAEELVKNRKKKNTPTKKKTKKVAEEQALSEQMTQNEERLRAVFATKVNIVSKGGKGKIELEFYNDDDFDRIFSQLLKP